MVMVELTKFSVLIEYSSTKSDLLVQQVLVLQD
jgi:hypothetical protein